MNNLRFVTTWIMIVVVTISFTSCRSLRRDLTLDQLVAGETQTRRDTDAVIEHRSSEMRKLAVNKLREARESGHPGCIELNILVLSGGGEYGAFGTGFLQGWGAVEDPQFTRPKFDIVTGVSTGALIAPFALAGSDRDIETVQSLYAEINPDLLNVRGLIPFIPRKESLFKNDKLREKIEENVTPELIKEIESAFAENRMLMISSTDLDLGLPRTWDIGYEFTRLNTVEEKRQRLTQILLASSAIPAVFPPIEIDGRLHTDGGASRMLFLEETVDDSESVVVRLTEIYPDIETITIRLWVIVNGKLLVAPEVIKPTWPEVARRGLSTLVQTSMVDQIQMLNMMSRIINDEVPQADAQVHFTAIPQNAALIKSKKMFDEELVAQLIALGIETGSDPSNWKNQVTPDDYYNRQPEQEPVTAP